MIRLIFQASNQVFMIVIDNNKIFWNDSKVGIQELYPNASPTAIKMGGLPTEEELKLYNMCKTEEELASLCMKDAREKGCRLIKQEKK